MFENLGNLGGWSFMLIVRTTAVTVDERGGTPLSEHVTSTATLVVRTSAITRVPF